MGLFIFLLGAVSSLVVGFLLLVNYINKAEEQVNKEYNEARESAEESDIQKVVQSWDKKSSVLVEAVGSADQPETLFAIVRANMLFLFKAELDVSASGVLCLDGCKVHVIKNNTEQSSPWHKKNPIQISCTDRSLLHNSNTLHIYCKSAKEAETWYYALAGGANLSAKKEPGSEQRAKKEQNHFRFLHTVLKNSDHHLSPSSSPGQSPAISHATSASSSSSPSVSAPHGPPVLSRTSSGSSLPIPGSTHTSPSGSPQVHHDLHSNLHSHLTWLNALLSRMFWNIHDAPDFSAFLTRKFNKKLLKVKKPSILKTVAICNVAFGPNLPMLISGHLDHIGATGEVIVSGDLVYHGGFTLTVSIGIEIEVMGHSLSVPVTVTVRVTRLNGRAVVCIPPPPSSRIWFAFEREPTCEIDVDTAFGTAGKVANIPRIAKIAVNALKTEMLKIIVLPNMEDFQLPKFKGQKGDKAAILPPATPDTPAPATGSKSEPSTPHATSSTPRSASPVPRSSSPSPLIPHTTTVPPALSKNGSPSTSANNIDHKMIDEALEKLASKVQATPNNL